MSWGRDIDLFRVTVERMSRHVLVRTAQLALDSVVLGSMLTGAPGQPVDTGYLRASWQLAWEGSGLAVISTNVEYALAIEEGIGPHGRLTLRSQVGGFHSVKLTVAGFDRIVRAAVEEARRAA